MRLLQSPALLYASWNLNAIAGSSLNHLGQWGGMLRMGEQQCRRSLGPWWLGSHHIVWMASLQTSLTWQKNTLPCSGIGAVTVFRFICFLQLELNANYCTWLFSFEGDGKMNSPFFVRKDADQEGEKKAKENKMARLQLISQEFGHIFWKEVEESGRTFTASNVFKALPHISFHRVSLHPSRWVVCGQAVLASPDTGKVWDSEGGNTPILPSWPKQTTGSVGIPWLFAQGTEMPENHNGPGIWAWSISKGQGWNPFPLMTVECARAKAQVEQGATCCRVPWDEPP